MAFLRRGNVKVPHKHSAEIIVHRFDGIPVRIKLDLIQCWEEHQQRGRFRVVVVYWDIASSTAVLETFEEIDQAVNGTGVQHVER